MIYAFQLHQWQQAVGFPKEVFKSLNIEAQASPLKIQGVEANCLVLFHRGHHESPQQGHGGVEKSLDP